MKRENVRMRIICMFFYKMVKISSKILTKWSTSLRGPSHIMRRGAPHTGWAPRRRPSHIPHIRAHGRAHPGRWPSYVLWVRAPHTMWRPSHVWWWRSGMWRRASHRRRAVKVVLGAAHVWLLMHRWWSRSYYSKERKKVKRIQDVKSI